MSASNGPAAGPEGPVAGYAQAIFHVAQAEDVLDRVSDELFRFARAVEDHAELRDRLTDPAVEVADKLKVVNDLLNKAHPQTVSAALYLVHAGRARQLEDIADRLAELVAEARAHAVAQVRTAVELDDAQRRRLSEAIEEATGKQVDLRVVVDPEVLGGVVVTVGDTVMDGSVSRQLSELRARLTGG